MVGVLSGALLAVPRADSTLERLVIVRPHDEVLVAGTRIACFVERNVDPPNQAVGVECGKGFAHGSWQAKTYGVTIRINDEVELFKIDPFAQTPGTVFQHGQVPWNRIGADGPGGRLVRVAVGDAFRVAGSYLFCDLRLTNVGGPRTPTLLCEVLANDQPPQSGSWAVTISDRLVGAVRFGANQHLTSSRTFKQP